ncbi:MAG: hypothetical protein IJ673_01945 [Treponema sp.]|nr:hypothetical protein [Treponema sp.]
MKKIVSAMALGALVLGAASAETKISINYRNGANIYAGTFEGDNKDATKTFLNQVGYNGGKDSVTLSAAGEIFNFKLCVQPTVKSDALAANLLEFGAKYGLDDLGIPGTIHAMGGFWADGQSNGNIRITTDASNFEGLDWEGNKPGSIFKGRPNTFVTNMVDFGLDQEYFTGVVDYTLPLDSLSLKVLGSVMTDRAVKDAGTTTGLAVKNDGAYSWGVNVNAKVPGVVELEALAKGNPKWNTVLNEDGDDYAGAMALGFYAMPLMVDGLKLAVGGSLGFIDGGVSDIAVDLRANYKVNDALSITSYNNISVVKQSADAGKATTDEYFNAQFGRSYFGSSNDQKGTAEKGTTGLWNMIGFAYKVSPTITARLSIEEQTMLSRNETAKDKGDDYKLGTTLRFTPAVELTAVKGASILAGVTCAMQGVGSDDEVYGEAVDWFWGIPVLFRVKM